MSHLQRIAALLLIGATSVASAREAKLLRSPHYHQGQVVFSYLGDVWKADEDGKHVQRLTVNRARDIHPRFSPDGRWVAFSSDREGNLDVYVMPASGGPARPLTSHSADDAVLGWSPDSKAVLFASQRGDDFMGKLYLVDRDSGLPRDAGPDMGVFATFSPDGKKLALNRKSQEYWRKHYRGAYQSDVTVMDLEKKTFKDLTDFDGIDVWPLWAADGHIYFVSDREGSGLTNLWRVPEGGGAAERVTSFTSGDVRWPSLSTDGKTIVFEHDFQVGKLDLATRQTTLLKFDIDAETEENLSEIRTYRSEADDYDVNAAGTRIAFAVHGEVFTVPTDEGDVFQITDGPARDQNVTFSPDGKSIAYVSDQTGRPEIYVATANGEGEARKVTDIDALKSAYAWSPDSKHIAFTTSEGQLYVTTAEGKETKELVSTRYGSLGMPAWSPDGRWLAYAKPDVSRTSDVYLIPSTGGEEKKVSFDSADEEAPRFSADGKKLYFLRSEASSLRGDRPTSQLYVVPLERLERDPDEPEAKTDANGPPASPEAAMRRMAEQRNVTPKEAKIDWNGLKRRTRLVTRTVSNVVRYTPAQDGRTLVFVAVEGGGPISPPTLYAIQDDGKRLSRLSSGAAPPSTEGDDDTPRERRGSGGMMSNLKVTRDGRSVYFKEGDGVYSVPLSLGPVAGGGPAGRTGGPRFGAAGGTGTPGGDSGGGARKRVEFTVRVRIDKPAEWAEMFDDAWHTMKYRFYDAKMHGQDWDAARAKYRPLVAHVGDRQELLNLVNEMIGELNASHTGTSAGRAPGRDSGVTTAHLGVDLVPDEKAGRYKVAYIYESGPADKDWIKLEVGHFVLALDGRPLKAGDDYWDRLNHRLNRRVELTVNDKPCDEGAWKVRIEPTTVSAYAQLRYDRWVKERRAVVDKQSDGRVGYIHIKAMDNASLRKFEKELREFRHKDGLVIDERWNGGGNIEQQLLAILVQRPYQIWQPRGTEPTQRPFAGYFGPKVVLQNWRSASNAEMFPAGFRALGLGKVVGTPTRGAVIGTGSYSLIDGSTIRTPAVGVYLADEGRTNMENTGVKPDVPVDNTPEDNLAGRDRQLEVAVDEVLKELKPRTTAAREH